MPKSAVMTEQFNLITYFILGIKHVLLTTLSRHIRQIEHFSSDETLPPAIITDLTHILACCNDSITMSNEPSHEPPKEITDLINEIHQLLNLLVAQEKQEISRALRLLLSTAQEICKLSAINDELCSTSSLEDMIIIAVTLASPANTQK